MSKNLVRGLQERGVWGLGAGIMVKNNLLYDDFTVFRWLGEKIGIFVGGRFFYISVDLIFELWPKRENVIGHPFAHRCMFIFNEPLRSYNTPSV